MARRLDSKGDPINRNRRASATASVDAYLNVDANINPPMDAASMGQVLFDAVSFFSEHDDGFLKIRRSLDSADLHLAYTWNTGPHAGSYVYVKTEHWRFTFGLALLKAKVLEAEDGYRKPTPDRFQTKQE